MCEHFLPVSVHLCTGNNTEGVLVPPLSITWVETCSYRGTHCPRLLAGPCHSSSPAYWMIISVCLGLDLWSVGAAAHSTAVSVGSRSARWQPPPMSQTRSSQRPLPPAPHSIRLTQPVLLLLDLIQARSLARSWGLPAVTEPSSFYIPSFYLLMSSSPISPSCACCSVFTQQPQNHKIQWIQWQWASRPSLSQGRLVTLWFCCSHAGGGFLKSLKL